MTSLRRRLRRVAAAAGRAVANVNQRGVLALGGVACLAIFAAQVWTPLPWAIVGGFLLIAAGAPARRLNE